MKLGNNNSPKFIYISVVSSKSFYIKRGKVYSSVLKTNDVNLVSGAVISLVEAIKFYNFEF